MTSATSVAPAAPSTPSPVVELPDGQVAVLLDAAALAQLGLKPGKPKAAPDSDGLFERSLESSLDAKTKAEYRRHFKEFKAFIAERCEGRSAAEATEEDVEDFFDHQGSEARVAAGPRGELRSHPLSASKLRGARSCLNRFFKLCQKKQHRFDNPIDCIKLKRPPAKRGIVLTDDEVRKLLDAPGRFDRCEVQCYLLHFSGARTGSLRNVRWQDVDFENDEIHLDVTKGDRAYTIPLHPELKAALLRWRSRQQEQAKRHPKVVAALGDPETAYLLLTYNGRKLCHTTMAKQYKSRAKRAGVRVHPINAAVSRENKSKVSPHAARRTVGTSLRRKGTDVADIADLLNHRDMQTTRDHYSFSSTPQKQKVMQKLQY